MNQRIYDNKCRVFIFSAGNERAFLPQEHYDLIYHGSGDGPTLGGGDEIGIFDCCNNSSSYANFPTTYNRAGGNKQVNNKDTYPRSQEEKILISRKKNTRCSSCCVRKNYSKQNRFLLIVFCSIHLTSILLLVRSYFNKIFLDNFG